MDSSITTEELNKWCENIIGGSGGLHDFESREPVDFGRGKKRRDLEVAKWVLRCLGNPQSEEAKRVVRRLMVRHGLPRLEDI